VNDLGVEKLEDVIEASTGTSVARGVVDEQHAHLSARRDGGVGHEEKTALTAACEGL
jgi:hypothetical protein